jgi:hypothetical protein
LQLEAPTIAEIRLALRAQDGREMANRDWRSGN